MKSETTANQKTESDAQKWIELIRQYNEPTELTPELLNALIEKIYIHEATKDAEGHKTQKIDIHYRFIGKIA